LPTRSAQLADPRPSRSGECHGAAGDPEASCTTETTVLTAPVTAVTQCNDAINGGGGTLRCSVQVTNTFVGLDPGATSATVNQCVGSGDGITTGCSPFPATTAGATITQCNGSANGGTLVGLTCTATGTASSAFGVTINQCNGSANGGGALVICSANVATSAAGPTAGPTTAPTVPPTDAPATTGDRGSGPVLLFFAAGLTLACILIARRRSVRPAPASEGPDVNGPARLR